MSRVLVLVLALSACGTAAAAQPEDFIAFLHRFRNDSQFRLSRVRFPLDARFGSMCEDDVKEVRWSRRTFAKNFALPLTLKELERHYLSEQITELSPDEIEIFQFRDEADSYLVTYRFRRSHGRWHLVQFKDESC